jgi:hypothetical protein
MQFYVCDRCGLAFSRSGGQRKHARKYCSAACYHAARAAVPRIDQFMRHVRKTETCWIWEGGTNGRYGVAWDGRREHGAHRLSWMLHRGPIPEGLAILHTCPGGDNPLCVNPDHLRPGTDAENSRDQIERGLSARGERNPRALITAEQVREIRRRYGEGETQASIGHAFGLAQPAVSDIVLRRNWKHVL